MVSKITIGSAEARLQSCRACEHYSEKGTCGTPVIGNDVIHEGVKYRTCGCKMSAKVLFPALSCPLGKWHAVVKLDESTKQKLRIFLGGLNPFRVSAEELKELYSFASDVNGKHTKVTTCPECVQNVIGDLRNLVKHDDKIVEEAVMHKEIEVVDKEVTKKTRRKRKA